VLLELIEIATNNSERLVLLINDILDIEKIKAGKMHFEFIPTNLMPIIEHAVHANQGFGEQYGVRFVFKETIPDAVANIDAGRITQVLTNLLSNAAKFSGDGDKVEISVTRCQNGLRIDVRDHGKGIPEEYQSKLFEKFVQAEASNTRQQGGTGLGLSIARAIVEQHQGELNFETQTGIGTCFYVILPEYRQTVKTGEVNTAHLDRRRILICEDDPDIAKLLQLILQQAGWLTDIALDAATAKTLLKQHSYCAMTLDLNLPDQDGISLLKELRADRLTIDLPIIVVSTNTSANTISTNANQFDGSAFGIIDWIEKPIDENHLLEILNRTMLRGNSGRSRILHVEDDPDLVRVVAALVGRDVEIQQAPDLQTAKALLEQEKYDLVIIDIGLPDGSGLELLPILSGPMGSVPVLVFSAQEVEKDLAGKVGAALVKSRTSNENLLTTIQSLIRERAKTG
jgi:DNA-binding response OmpR family regulator